MHVARFERSDPQGLLRLVSTKTRVNRLESPLTFLLYISIFKVQGFSVSRQRREACLQRVVECNPWFPNEGSSARFLAPWALTEAVILPFQGNASPHDIQQQAEHLLPENKLDDDILQKAQLEQQKILQDFPTRPTQFLQATPLPEGTYPIVSPSLKPNDSDNNSLKTPFNIKTDNTFLNNNNLPPCSRGSLNCWLCNQESLKLMVFLPFQF